MPSALAQPTAGYIPRSPTDDLKEIIGDYYEELFEVWDDRFRQTYGSLHPRLRELFERFLRCGDPHFGFIRLYCDDCKENRYVPHSCKVRGLCASCSQKRSLLWAERMVAEVLPLAAYAQLVFTIPKILRKAFLYRRELYGKMCQVAYSSTCEFLAAHYPSLERPMPAMAVVPQSFGDLLLPHAHAHAVCSLGVYDREGNFHPAPEDLDFSPLEGIFREKIFKMLLENDATTSERVEMLRSWRHSGFAVHSQRRIKEGERAELERLLQYLVRAPVSLRRLEYDRESGRVTYRGKFNPSLGRDYQNVSGLEFLAMIVPHILLRYESVIRCYGAISTTWRVKFGWISDSSETAADGECDESSADGTPGPQDKQESEFAAQRKKTWSRLIQKTWLEDPELCPKCGKKMRVISAVSSPAQDDVIEKILRHYSHNTNSPLFTIHYPFHPLAGTRFRPVRASSGPPPFYLLQLADHRLAVPTWMTENWTSRLHIEDLPFVSVDHLLDLASIVETSLEHLESPSCILPSDSVPKEDHKNGNLDSADFSRRPGQRRDPSAAGRSGDSRRGNGKVASSSSKRARGKGEWK